MMDKIIDKVILKLYVKDKYLNPHPVKKAVYGDISQFFDQDTIVFGNKFYKYDFKLNLLFRYDTISSAYPLVNSKEYDIEFIYSDKIFKTKDPTDKLKASVYDAMHIGNEREIAYKCEQASLFEMVAEECSELSHVSSKIARYLRKDQPVSEDFNIMSAFTNFLEEFADVYLAAKVAQRSTDSFSYFNEKKFEEFYHNKLDRWVKRLNEKNDTSEE